VKLALAALLPACIGGVPAAQCAVDQDCGATSVCIGAVCHAGSRELDGGVCESIHPSWTDINQNFIQVGCGVRSTNCHSAEGAAAGSGLVLAGDAYARLVNAASADGGFILVKPGDPDHSFLSIKLRLTTTYDPQYGSGMPPDRPGQTCATAQEAVRQWILGGAGRN
jgi:hypothetical protein